MRFSLQLAGYGLAQYKLTEFNLKALSSTGLNLKCKEMQIFPFNDYFTRVWT
jgi:hypothetical protein